jgi:hypothetical protein
MNMKLKPLYTLALAALMATGCKKSFLDVNTNPNSLPSATPAFILTNAINTTASSMVSPNEIGSYWSGLWTQSSSYILSPTTFNYQFTNNDYNYWDGLFDNLQDYQYVIDNATGSGQKYFLGPAKVMKAYVYQALLDMYGDVPYSDALKGVGSLAPKFDDSKTVYEGLVTLLDGAIADLKANAFASSYAGADIVFGGNTTKWVRFANSLKLRLLLHQSRVSGRDAYITTEINKIVTEGSGFITGEDVGSGGPSLYLATAGKLNPIYDRWGYDANGAVRALARYPRPTKFLFDNLVATNDTLRMKRIAYAKGGENGATPGVSTQPELVSNYVGVPFGFASGYTAPSTSYIGPSLLVKGQYNRPVILMTAAEIQFNLAEAKQRFPSVTLTGTAQSYYEEGIRQSFRTLGVANATTAANTFMAQAIDNVSWTTSTNKLNAIAYQKWLALCNFSGLEAWVDYRKNNYPNTPQSPGVPGTDRPLRFFYPNTESGSNANVPKGIDVFKTRLFWDVD